MAITIPDEPNLPAHRPGIAYESGRVWIPGYYITDDVFNDGAVNALNLGSAMNCSPYTKYVFVTPGGNYDMQEFTDWRNDNYSVTTGLLNAVAGFVFFLGDSSSCGGTVIAHDPTDETQAFLRSSDARVGFSAQQMTRGGFFLLGDQQGVGAAAAQIKKIIIDCNLDFLVLAAHRAPGGAGLTPDISVDALRHLIASIRWDIGPKLPIIIMVGDENTNHHLMPESQRDTLFVGDVTDQDTRQKQIDMGDRYGFTGVNFWPLMAFMPNADNGPSVETSMTNMDNRLFHPLLVPATGSGCPFNTTRALTTNELSAARIAFAQTAMFPLAEPKVRTTSAWFWDWATVKDNSTVAGWSVLRHRLDGDSDNLDFMSDMQVVFESNPVWVGHPIYDKPFAIELRSEPRSGAPNFLVWDRDVQGAGNIPAQYGAKDERDGWITVITPFELSPTANTFYQRDVYAGDPRGVPVIPPYVKFSWLRPITQEAIDAANAGTGGHNWLGLGLLSPGDVIGRIIDLASDALEYIPDRLGLLGDTNDAGFIKWSAGLNQPHVVLHGKPEGGADVESVQRLDLNVAPFAVQIQTINFEMNGDLGFVWPARVFNIVPVMLPDALREFALDLTSADLSSWDDLGMDFSGKGTTPLQYKVGDEGIRNLVEQATSLRIPRWSVLRPEIDHKADFPPMLDGIDGSLGRDFSQHLARIDITHPRVLRSREIGMAGGGGGGGVFTRGVLTTWPIPDDREITITRGFLFEDSIYDCGKHNALDLVYTDGSEGNNTDILAAGPGVVETVSHCPDCGPFIEIRHQIPPLPSMNTFITRYLHLSSTLVQEGDLVDAGDVIGKMGAEGTESTGVHLHFSIIKGGPCDALNPCDELPFPANGITPSDCGSPMGALICVSFEAAIEAAGDDPYLVDQYGNRLRKSTLAVAIARAESGLNPTAGWPLHDNGFNNDPVTTIDRGLFQINSCWAEGGAGHACEGWQPQPLVAAGIITAASIQQVPEPASRTFAHPISHSDDLYIPSINIDAALHISNNGSVWTAWSTYNAGTYRDLLGRDC
jgi:hypothetical protein